MPLEDTPEEVAARRIMCHRLLYSPGFVPNHVLADAHQAWCLSMWEKLEAAEETKGSIGTCIQDALAGLREFTSVGVNVSTCAARLPTRVPLPPPPHLPTTLLLLTHLWLR